MTYEQIVEQLLPLVGKTVRLNYPRGYERHGVVSFETIGCHENCINLDGRFYGGEIEGVTSIEVKGENGRYA